MKILHALTARPWARRWTWVLACVVWLAPSLVWAGPPEAEPLSAQDAAALLDVSDVSEAEIEVLREMVASGITADDLRAALEAQDMSDAEMELLRERFRSSLGAGHVIGIGMAMFVLGVLAGMGLRRTEAAAA